jgi:squalene synthase HpnC
MGVDHYENFPVASLLLPARLRPAVRAIYAFARAADDIADEGEAPPAERIEALAALGCELDRIDAGLAPRDPRWAGLAHQLRAHALPTSPLRDLLSAFTQDARGTTYEDHAQLLDYCARSANPVGRMMLALHGRTEARLLAWSDAICTGLQLVNFWQDLAIDQARGRVYLPRAELARFGLDASCLAAPVRPARWGEMMRAQTQRARELLLQGWPLAAALGGRIGWELRLVVEGGLHIAGAVDAAQGDVYRYRPRLRAADWARLVVRAALRAGAPNRGQSKR